MTAGFQGSAVPSFLFVPFSKCAHFLLGSETSFSLRPSLYLHRERPKRRLTRLLRLCFVVSRYHLASMELNLVRRRLIYLVRYCLMKRTQEHVSKEPATIPSPCFKVQRGVGHNSLGITSTFAMSLHVRTRFRRSRDSIFPI